MTATFAHVPGSLPALGVVASLLLNACGSSPPPAAASADHASNEAKVEPRTAKRACRNFRPPMWCITYAVTKPICDVVSSANPNLRGAVRFA